MSAKWRASRNNTGIPNLLDDRSICQRDKLRALFLHFCHFALTLRETIQFFFQNELFKTNFAALYAII